MTFSRPLDSVGVMTNMDSLRDELEVPLVAESGGIPLGFAGERGETSASGDETGDTLNGEEGTAGPCDVERRACRCGGRREASCSAD